MKYIDIVMQTIEEHIMMGTWYSLVVTGGQWGSVFRVTLLDGIPKLLR
jgi:hypothetical protein